MAALLLALAMLTAPIVGSAKSSYVAGAGDIPLAVTDVGHDGPAIIFLHGLGQGKESFLPQLESVALRGHHMVAFDLRGHGMSAKPWQESDYTDSKLWARDVQAVVQATGLQKPVLVAWSYGALVAADYIRAFGTDSIAGLVLISSFGGLIAPPPAQPGTALPPDLLRARGLLSVPSLADQREAVSLIVPMLASSDTPGAWTERASSLGLMVPPYVQPHLRKHPFNNTDLLPRLDIPVLFVHGGFEASFSQATIDSFLKAVPCGRAIHYLGHGHSPFASASGKFNTDLAEFVAAVQPTAISPDKCRKATDNLPKSLRSSTTKKSATN